MRLINIFRNAIGAVKQITMPHNPEANTGQRKENKIDTNKVEGFYIMSYEFYSINYHTLLDKKVHYS